MAGMNIFRVGICAAMFVTRIVAQDMWNVLDIHCDTKTLIAGAPVTLQHICGEMFQVHVHGISDTERFPDESFPWKLEVTLVTDESDPGNILKSTKTVLIERSSLHYGDNVTDVVNEYLSSLENPLFDIPGGKCDNRDGKGIMRLYSEQSGFDEEFSGKGFVRILCDFSGADLRLEVLTSTGQPYLGNIFDNQPIQIAGDNINTTKDLFFATELENMMVVVKGDVPVLEPADTCVFAIAFLTKSHGPQSFTNSQQCTDLGPDAHFPEITYHDTLIGIPICITNGNIGQDLLQMVMGSSENISLCGYYTLVLQVDPMHTLHNELNKCNNYITLDFYFSCGTFHRALPRAHCDILTGPFGSSVKQLFDTRVIYHRTNFDYTHYETQRDIRMFRQEKRAWIESHDDGSGVENIGFGLVKVYNRYMESNDIGSTCTDLVTEMNMHNAISELEGLTEDWIPLTEDTDIETLVPEYSYAKTKMDQFSSSEDYDTIFYETKAAIDGMINPPESSPFNEHVQFLASKGALNATLMLADAFRNGIELHDVKMDVSKLVCGMADWLEHMPMLLMSLNEEYNPEYQMYGKESLMHLVGNLTSAVLMLRHVYPEFTCLKGELVNWLTYVNSWTVATTEERRSIERDWMYDMNQVKDTNKIGDGKLAFSDCMPMPNQCVRKLQTLCLQDPMSTTTPVADNKHHICRARYLKQQAEKQYRILGLLNIKEKMRDFDMSDKCRNDPIAPQTGPLTLWKLENEHVGHGQRQVMYKGMPSLDNKNIMWKKVSVCTCEECHDSMRKKRK